MRIVHVTDRRYPPSADDGGAPQALASLCVEQQRQGHDVRVATTARSDGPGVWSLGPHGSATSSLLKRVRDEWVDVVHFHALASEMQGILHVNGIPTVMHVHGTHHGHPLEGVNAIYVSRRHAEAHGAEVYVDNGIDIEGHRFQPRALDYLAFLGKVRRSKKGADIAVSVANRTRRQLQLVGGRKFSIPQTWLPFQRRIKALGVLGGEPKMAVLRDAAALLFPVRWEEPFGLVLIEAMASGTPVIAFNRGAVPDIVVDGVTGFVVDDFEQMCAAVGRIDEIDRAACRHHVAERFSIERTANGVMACYRRAIAGEQW